MRPILTAILCSALVACASPEVGTQTQDQPLEVSKPTQGAANTPVVAAPPAPAKVAETVRALAPRVTRAGLLRFADPAIENPSALPVLLERLASGADDSATRVALAEALPATQGDFAARAVELLASERDPAVKATLATSLGRAKSADALPGLRSLLTDADAEVRTRAAEAIGHHPRGAELAEALVSMLRDSEPAVQAQAARALGILGVAEAFDALVPALASDSTDVRLEALRALGRVDADRASALSELARLRTDSDVRIQTAAQKVADRAYRR